MIHRVGVLGIFAVATLGSARTQAAVGWVQVPGAATQIAVGASDYPFVLDTNGFIQYLDQPQLVCGAGLCVPQRQWISAQRQYTGSFATLPTVKMSRIATNLYGYVSSIDVAGGLWLGYIKEGKTFTQITSGAAACATSLAPGLMKNIPREWNHAFGTPWTNFDVTIEQSRTYGATYITGCSPSLLSTDFTWHGKVSSGSIVNWFTSNGWQSLDNAESQVAMFTVDGSATNQQVPWVRAPLSNGLMTVWTYVNGDYIAAPLPKLFNFPFPISYVTDHFVVAANRVWRWWGDAYGNRANPVWGELENSSLPDAAIKEIAYSWPAKTADGWTAKSHLWMVDSKNRIWQYGDITLPPE